MKIRLVGCKNYTLKNPDQKDPTQAPLQFTRVKHSGHAMTYDVPDELGSFLLNRDNPNDSGPLFIHIPDVMEPGESIEVDEIAIDNSSNDIHGVVEVA